MICTIVIPCLSSGLAKNYNKTMAMFVLFSRLLGEFESLTFFLQLGGGGGQTLHQTSQTRMFLVNFSKVEQLSNNFSKKCYYFDQKVKQT